MKLEELIMSIKRGLGSLSCRESIVYCVIYGSTARGHARSTSDVDIGLRIKDGSSGLSIKVEAILAFSRVLSLPEDLVDVKVFRAGDISSSPLFFYEMLSEAVFVEGDEGAFLEDLVRAAMLYADLKIQLKKARSVERYIEALGEAVRRWESSQA